MTFNEKIDKYMKENNISDLKQFSSLVDIPYTTLRDFYKKESADNSRLATIRKLSKYMNCTMDYLAYDEIEDVKDMNNDELTQVSSNHIDDDIDALLNAYKNLPDLDKKWVKNMVIERRNLIDEQLENDND